jgi:hypothetical protein
MYKEIINTSHKLSTKKYKATPFFSDTRHGKGCFFHSISKTLAKAPRSLPLFEGKAAQDFGVQSISSLYA